MQSYPSAVRIPTIGLEERREKKQSGGKTCVGSVCRLHWNEGGESKDSIFAVLSVCFFCRFFLNGIRTQQQALLNCYKDLLV